MAQSYVGCTTVRLPALRRGAAFAAALTLLGAAAASAQATSTPAATFSGKLCPIVTAREVRRAGIAVKCTETKSFSDSLFSAGHTASWGTQAVIGGADHYLSVSVYTPRDPRYIPEFLRMRRGFPRAQRIPRGILQTISYHGSRGGEGFAVFVVGGLYCQLNLLEDPATQGHVASALQAIITRLRHRLAPQRAKATHLRAGDRATERRSRR